jgi:hypothetical protein
MRSDIAELLDKQAQIIRLQSETIASLFTLLLQFMSVEDEEGLPCNEALARAAELRADTAQAMEVNNDCTLT